jgi:outer membrane protein OmpA-like peptidoglycan-associated protein
MNAPHRSRRSLDACTWLTTGLALASLVGGVPACAGEKLRGDVEGIQTSIQRAIRSGSKTIGCAPKETALAEANVKFAEDALKMGEYYRGQEHVELAEAYAKIANAKTDPVKCREPGVVAAVPGDIADDQDQDGYDDKVDGCPKEPEDFDSFEDEDGCPDRDNDKDGVLDASEFIDRQWVNLDQKDGRDCRNEPEDVDEFEDEDGCPDPDNDKDGIPDTTDVCKNDPEDVDSFEDEDGCPDPDNDKDGICDPWVAEQGLAEKYASVCRLSDKCPMDPEDIDGEADDDGCPDLKAQWDGCQLKIDDKVYFAFNKWDIDPRSFKLLDDVVTALNSGDNIKVTVEIGGHTDGKGSDKYNKKLSQKRVNSVLEYLVGKGVARERLTAVGYGEERPIDSNRTNEGRANNRRVEFLRTDNECKK